MRARSRTSKGAPPSSAPATTGGWSSPNADLFTDTVVVNTAVAHRRLEYDVGMGYGDNVEQARGLILEAVHSVEGVLSDPAPGRAPDGSRRFVGQAARAM